MIHILNSQHYIYLLMLLIHTKNATPWNKFKSIVFLPQLFYKIDDELYKAITPIVGKIIIPEAEPIKEGYTFSGWSEIPETMSAHDITIIGSYTSGINAIQIEAENGKVYELNGRHVKNPSKGIYIINGKKVVVK